MTKKLDSVLVLDFGGQYCHLIARSIRDLGVYSEIISLDMFMEKGWQEESRFIVKGLILSGGPSSVYDQNAPKIDSRILDIDIPILGLCYGHQLIAYTLGGKVGRGIKQEYGAVPVTIDKPVGILEGLSYTEKVWMSHGDTVQVLPEGFESLASSQNCQIAAYRHKEKAIYGLQWHPEVTHTEHGKEMLKNFIFKICQCEPNWKPASLIAEKIIKMKNIIGEDKAVIALSGGIDSSAAAIIATKAIGDNLTAIFVDHGFMRQGEPEFVEETFRKIDVKVKVVRARERFFKKLEGIIDPEEKRRIIGNEFIFVFEEVAKGTGAKYLIQGTIYPDKIESGFRKHSEKIKTHHNVAGLPTNIKFTAIIEPLEDLYKDEVRKLAKHLGLPNKIVRRQPFPGPGLAVRVIGALTKEKVDLVRRADKIVQEMIEKTNLKNRLWQYFAVITNSKSTGVKGDSRAYGYVLAIRIVESREAMTASFAKIPYNLLEKISTRITNELPLITRVVYDITHKPPATIEWE
jgi:GMP synthase (glutamine-hydrolysing)